MPSESRAPAARLLTAAAAACLLLSACGGEAASPGPGEGASAAVVTTAEVTMAPWRDTISALGTVKARESVTITAKVSETVDRVHFDSGDEVEAGATLITLSGNQQQAALQAAEAAAKEAEQQFRRGSELVGQQLIARSQVDTQRATLDAARARVTQMRADIGDRRIRAPFAGMLGIRQVSPGALVTPGTVVATLDDLARVHVDFPVPEVHLAQLQQGQSLTGTSVAWPGAGFDGEVSSIDTRVDPATRAVTVRGDFPNPDRRLRPGMLMQVQLGQASREALVVPEIAVVQVGRDTFVWRMRGDGTVETANIVVGERRAGSVEVVKGLAAGDRIVVEGTGKLRPGMAVEEAAPVPAAETDRESGAGAPAASDAPPARDASGG
ncbi:efflux RND transporter periplasmic adaptor subunit [Luteimonas kalidii]|uniref:Efflux RND transporter periplasmic adaptor subunit n=1 Tax=Luteimonas kalidii TaxID=3042025 RepID=A0ABT6JVF9_9GAMM|nr:efflux RND transporter periplasmic adaptor subunit [Luteimonas kalidii]MDH5834584.1 efflux RND transporter periplasmic adaptor subunit [Luteimonas kalidii]